MKWGISAKLALSFLLLLIVVAIMGYVSSQTLYSIKDESEKTKNQKIPSMEAVSTLIAAEYGVLARERQLVNPMAMAPKIRKAGREGLDEAWALYDTGIKQAKSLKSTNKEIAALWDKVYVQFEAWREKDDILKKISDSKDKLVAKGVALSDPQI